MTPFIRHTLLALALSTAAVTAGAALAEDMKPKSSETMTDDAMGTKTGTDGTKTDTMDGSMKTDSMDKDGMSKETEKMGSDKMPAEKKMPDKM